MTESWRVALTIKNKMHFQANVYPRPDHMLDESCKLWILAAKNPRKVGAVKSLVNESRKEGDSVACVRKQTGSTDDQASTTTGMRCGSFV